MVPPKKTAALAVPLTTLGVLAMMPVAASLAAVPEPDCPRPGEGWEALRCSSIPADAGGAPDVSRLPRPPRILFQVGETRVTTFALERGLSLDLRAQRRLREELVKAGRWGAAEETEFADLRARRAGELKWMLVGRALMEDRAREAGYRPNELQVERRLRSRIRRAGGLEALVRQVGMSLDEIRDEIRSEELRRRFQARYVLATLDPGPREMREHYEANRSRLRTPSRLKVRAILIASGTSATRDEKAASEKADGLRRELQNFDPTRFEDRAREHSDHKETAKRGGLLVLTGDVEEPEWIPYDRLVKLNPAVALVASRLKPGEVSGVKPVPGGFLLVKLDGRRPGRALSLAEALHLVRGDIRRRREGVLLNEWIGHYLRRTYFVDGRGQRVSLDGSASENGHR